MMIIQSLMQIILESLPVSSSGHLVLMQRIMHWQEFSKSFEYVLHGPTIIVLVVYFRTTWFPLLKQCWRYRALIMRMIAGALAADTITAVIYGCMQWLAPYFPLWSGFATTACLLLSLQWVSYKKEQMSYKKAIIIGCVQGVSGLPGISRLASTYTAGVWLGLSPQKSFYFSCMIQFPLICAGFLYGLVRVHNTEYAHYFLQPYFIVAISIAAVIAYLLLWWVQQRMQQRTLWKFGYYMVVPLCLALFC